VSARNFCRRAATSGGQRRAVSRHGKAWLVDPAEDEGLGEVGGGQVALAPAEPGQPADGLGGGGEQGL